MNAQTVPDASVLDALDFDPVIPCEGTRARSHPTTGDHPAVYVLSYTCPTCGAARTMPVCAQVRARVLGSRFLRHTACGVTAETVEFGLRFTPIVRSLP